MAGKLSCFPSGEHNQDPRLRSSFRNGHLGLPQESTASLLLSLWGRRKTRPTLAWLRQGWAGQVRDNGVIVGSGEEARQ